MREWDDTFDALVRRVLDTPSARVCLEHPCGEAVVRHAVEDGHVGAPIQYGRARAQRDDPSDEWPTILDRRGAGFDDRVCLAIEVDVGRDRDARKRIGVERLARVEVHREVEQHPQVEVLAHDEGDGRLNPTRVQVPPCRAIRSTNVGWPARWARPAGYSCACVSRSMLIAGHSKLAHARVPAP